jgi:thiol-disulfide isomerase/thioredoxin
MRRLRGTMGMGVLALALWQVPPAAPQGSAANIDLKVVSYDDLAELIRANQGKVVVVDFWALSCGPCKRNFPHVVQMYKEYKDKGLVVISVATDPLRGEDIKDPRPRILNFLQDNKAVFTNVVIDEPDTVLRDRLRVLSLPCMYIFDREGKWRYFRGNNLVDAEGEIRHDQIEGLVKKLLE